MKKTKIIILLLVILMVFSSCITKQDIKDKEDILKDLKDEYDQLDKDYTKLEDELSSLNAELDETTTACDEIEAANEDISKDIASLKKRVPNPPFLFLRYQFVDNILETIDESGKGATFKRALANDQPVEKSASYRFNEFVYELKGDIESEKYISLTFITGDDYDEVYDIIIEYSSDVYKEDYEELVQVVLTALIMITEEPYGYESEYFKSAEDILEEGSYFNDFVRIDQELDGEVGITKIYCCNY